MIKRKIYSFRKGDILEVEEHHDGRYGAPGMKRAKKRKRTEEDIERVNQMNKMKRCRHRLLEYFDRGDLFCTLTYAPEKRPEDMQQALKDFRQFTGKVGRKYKSLGQELRWIRNIERGTKGAWHVHLVINKLDGAEGIIREAWKHGGIYVEALKDSKFYAPDFSDLAAYMTKSEKTKEKRKDGQDSRPRIKESSYATSRNMPLKEPKEERRLRWKQEPKPKKGYYIEKMFEGINPVTGYLYRRYTMISLGDRPRRKKKRRTRRT